MVLVMETALHMFPSLTALPEHIKHFLVFGYWVFQQTLLDCGILTQETIQHFSLWLIDDSVSPKEGLNRGSFCCGID